MKKLFFLTFVLFFSSLCFAIPNMKLYEDAILAYQISGNAIYNSNGEIICKIRDGSLYDAHNNNEHVGTISETDDTIMVDWYSDGKKEAHSEYNKRTGFLLLQQTDWDISEYNETTGLIKKRSYCFDGKINSYELYEYEKGKVTKISRYKADGSFDGFCQFLYDGRTKNKIKESYFTADNRLKRTIEYDSATEKQIKKSEYNDDGSLRTQIIYDKNSEEAIERLIYSTSSKKPVKRTYLKFDGDGNYTLSDDFYLSKTFCLDFGMVIMWAILSQSEPIDWNENYSAFVRKYNFDKNTAGYPYIENLINKHCLIRFSFTLCNKNSNIYYCFITKDDEIDLSSCYEIELIKKRKDYPSMNKSGKGKGPFGFDIGMTYDEVKAACGGSEPEHIADNRYYVKPKKAHPLFEKYIVWISDAVGLYYIRGISRDIQTSGYGTEAKQQFDNLLSPLEKKYRKFSLTNTIKSDYYWKDEKYWMRALRDGARTYIAQWNVSRENQSNFDGLVLVGIGVSANKYSNSEAYIWIEYGFQNYNDAQESLDDVL